MLGHETFGEVAQVGAAVTGFSIGGSGRDRSQRRLRQLPHVQVQGFNQLCPTYEAFGISLDGGFAEYMRVPASALGNVAKVPTRCATRRAVLIEPLSCVFNAYEAHRTVPGDTVLIIGAGPIGALHAMLNKLQGDASSSRTSPRPASGDGGIWARTFWLTPPRSI